MEGWEEGGIYRTAHLYAIDEVRERGYFEEPDSERIYHHLFLKEVTRRKKEEKAIEKPKQKRAYVKRAERWGI